MNWMSQNWMNTFLSRRTQAVLTMSKQNQPVNESSNLWDVPVETTAASPFLFGPFKSCCLGPASSAKGLIRVGAAGTSGTSC